MFGTHYKSNSFRRTALATAAGLMACGVASSVMAQGLELEEIVVRGLKREQSLQDVPAAITVFSAQSIERQNITRPEDFIALTPNVNMSNSNHAGETLITVRGDAQTRNTEAPVAIVVDGVVLTGRNQFNGELFDLEQIEVLKGPQGYLYGRNAIAGAIVITTAAPSNEFEGRASFGYGNAQEARASLAVSGPIIEDELYIRLSGTFRDHEGHFFNETRQDFEDPLNEKVGRARLLWTPSEDFTFDLRGSLSRVQGGATYFQPQSLIPDLQTTPQGANIDVNAVDEIPFVRNVDGGNRQTKDSFSLKMDYATDAGTITSVTTYDDVLDVFFSDDFPYFPTADSTQFNVVSHEAWSQELRFTSPTENRLRYIFGGYFASIKNEPNIHAALATDPGGFVLEAFEPIPSTTSFISDDVQTDVWALFGIVSYDITDDLELTVAGRFDREKKDTQDVAPIEFSATSGLERSQTFKEFQPKVNLTWRATDDLTLYGGYAKGFQAGGFNGAQTFERTGGTVPNEYGETTADNFELGFKSAWAEGQVVLNGAVFYNTKKNAQQFQFVPAGTLNAVTVIDEIELIGGELEMAAQVTDNFSLNVGLGYIDAEITRLAADPISVGNRAPYVPEFTASVSATHVADMDGLLNTNGLSLVTNVSYEHRGSMEFNSRNSFGSTREALDLVAARISLETDDWSFAFWGKNLTNKVYPDDVVTVFTDAPLTTYVSFRSQPRTWGAQLTVNF